MDAIEALNGPFRDALPFGPRSQGGVDEHYDAELHALLDIPSLSCDTSPVDERAPMLLRAVHLRQHPDAAAYPEVRVAEMFSDWLLELREAYRALHSPGKRPWPAFMQAALSGRMAAPDCDAVFALTGVHLVGRDSVDAVLVGDYLAGAALDTPVLMGSGTTCTLESALPAVVQLKPTIKGAALSRAAHDTASRTRIQGVGGHRRMTRDELLSEVARRSAEISEFRRIKGRNTLAGCVDDDEPFGSGPQQV